MAEPWHTVHAHDAEDFRQPETGTIMAVGGSALGDILAYTDQTCGSARAGAARFMTPIYNSLAKFLRPAMVRLVMLLIYATLLVLVLTFLVPPGEFDLVYLDIGR